MLNLKDINILYLYYSMMNKYSDIYTENKDPEEYTKLLVRNVEKKLLKQQRIKKLNKIDEDK
jgi:hypothetical protein